jgi:hypothetical protein
MAARCPGLLAVSALRSSRLGGGDASDHAACIFLAGASGTATRGTRVRHAVRQPEPLAQPDATPRAPSTRAVRLRPQPPSGSLIFDYVLHIFLDGAGGLP